MKFFKLCTCFSLFIGTIGCGGGTVGNSDLPETAPVTVTVTYKSAPLADATVTFSPKNTQNGKAAYGKTDASGVVKLNTFPEVEGVVPGEYNVLVSKMEVAASKEVSMDDPNYTGEPTEPPAAAPKSLIPEKYNAATTSKLEASVKAGQDNPFTFDLVD
jgi:hypothetical protein